MRQLTTNCIEPENAKDGKDLAGRGFVVPKGKGAKLSHKQKMGDTYSMNADMPNILPDGILMNKHMQRLILSKPHSRMERLMNIMNDIDY